MKSFKYKFLMKNINLKSLIILIFLINFSIIGNVSSEEFWSNKDDGPKNKNQAIKLLEGKQLDIIEGLWFTEGLGTIVIFKEEDIFKMYIVSGPTDFNGTWEATILKRGNQYDFLSRVWYSQSGGGYTFSTQTGVLEVTGNYFITKYDSLSDEGVDMDSKFVRVWPKDYYTNNDNSQSSNTSNEVAADEKSEKFYDLPWYNLEDSKNHWVEIPNSNSEVNILENEIYLIGYDNINKFTNLLFEDEANDNDLLIIDNESFDYSIYVNYIDDGYVSIKDWESVDSDDLLEEMKKTSKDDVIDLHWVFKPKISDKNFVTYSYKVTWENNNESLETTVLSLGRRGYNEISLITKIDDNFNAKEIEDFATNFAETVTFKDGYRYADYKSGDKTAAVGIGSLVAGTLGVKALAKAGVLAKILAFAGKFWWIIAAPLVAFFAFLKNKKEPNIPSQSQQHEEVKVKKPVKRRKAKSKKID